MLRLPVLLSPAFLIVLLGVAPGSPAQTPAPQTVPVPTPAPPVPTPTPPPAVETPDYPGAVWEPASPANFQPSNRPSTERPIDRIVIHDIEGTAISAVRWFQNPKAQASSHYVVDGTTGKVYQMIKERDVAWHAGDRITNARSVGIEHEGYAYRPGFFNPVEYEAAASLTRAIALRYDIPRDRTHIIGHFEVPDSANPGKFGGRSGHTDPGPYWDWDYFMALTRNDAEPILDVSSFPKEIVLHPGETKDAGFTMMNTGDDPWLADPKAAVDPALRGQGPVYLGVYASDTTWGPKSVFYGAGWVSPRFARSPADGDTPPGAAGRFTIPLHAPDNFLGSIKESFRLYKVPIAPRLPVPFGPTLTVNARVEPWEIVLPLPATAPGGWETKTQPDGSKVFWRKAGSGGGKPTIALNWETELPIAGEWDIYVRYPAGAGRAPYATYTIDTMPDDTRLTSRVIASQAVNQRKGGGAWQKLGRYRFDAPPAPAAPTAGVRPGDPLPPNPAIRGRVALQARSSVPGILVGGEVRFVGPFPVATSPKAL